MMRVIIRKVKQTQITGFFAVTHGKANRCKVGNFTVQKIYTTRGYYCVVYDSDDILTANIMIEFKPDDEISVRRSGGTYTIEIITRYLEH